MPLLSIKLGIVFEFTLAFCIEFAPEFEFCAKFAFEFVLEFAVFAFEFAPAPKSAVPLKSTKPAPNFAEFAINSRLSFLGEFVALSPLVF